MNRTDMKNALKLLILGSVAFVATSAHARDVDYTNSEVSVFVTPGEPTQVQFPGEVTGGVKRKASALSLQYTKSDLVLFASEGISDQGEAIIVRLKDGRSFSLRVRRAGEGNNRDDVIKLNDRAGAFTASDESEEPAYKEKKFDYAPPTQVSGLVREMVLAAEFGKKGIAGYRPSDRFRGETVLNDGTIKATIETIFVGSNLWGYVIEAQNLLDQSQKINPASFRLDGTRAVSATNWELAARPVTLEQQIAGKDKTKIYIVTRARSGA
jgi:hypothetical protein